MSNETSLEKMKSMKLHGMARAFESTIEIGFEQLTIDELIAYLIDAEWDDKYNRKITRLITSAKFRYKSSLEELKFSPKRKLDKNLIMRLSNCDWIKKKQDIVITGKTGTGKSFLACALGNKACINGYSTLYFNSNKLFNSMKMKKLEGTYEKEIDRIKKADLLIIDDFGLETFDHKTSMFLMEIIEDRHKLKSTIVSGQYPIASWHEIIKNPTIADAICDRFAFSAHKIDLKGDTMRKKAVEEELT